jgi:hypothetical protein
MMNIAENPNGASLNCCDNIPRNIAKNTTISISEAGFLVLSTRFA